MNDRFQALELKQQQTSHAGNTGPHEEESSERDATEVGGREITPPEQLSRLAASSSYKPSRFFQREQPRQQTPPSPPSQPPPLTYHYSQPFSAQNLFWLAHTIIHSPSLPQNIFWLADHTNLFLPRLENRHTDPCRLPELEV